MTEQNKPGVATGVFTSPIDEKHNPVPTSHYGRRKHPVTGEQGKHHNGVDIGLRGGQRKGIPHLATDGGIVTYASPAGKAGNVVVIDHGNGVVSRYFHLAKIDRKIKVGEPVAKGQVIGEVGRTGAVTGIHVHWEVLRGKTQGVGNGLGSELARNGVDPEPFLRNGDYSKIIVQNSAQTASVSTDNLVEQEMHSSTQDYISLSNNYQTVEQVNAQSLELKDLYKRIYDLATEASGGDNKKLLKNLADYGEIGEVAYAQNDPSMKDLSMKEQEQQANKVLSAAQNVGTQNTL